MWPVCRAWEAQGSCPLPGAGRDRLQGRRPGVSPLDCSSSLFCHEAEMPGESKSRPRERRRKRGHPRGGACRVGLASPVPCSGGASSPLPVSREAIRSYVKGGPQDISRYICSSYFSETQHRGSQGKAWGQGRGAQKGHVGPLQAVPSAGLEAAACCCRSSWSGDLLPERSVGSSGQRGR